MSEDLRQLRQVDCAIALIAKLAETSGLTHFVVELSYEEIVGLLKKYEVEVRRVGENHRIEFKVR